ncbi:MAG: DUF6541 family protein [Tractidigestivibacter sp.]|uniref:DUF6541 family protein n=1 Tax=Tractidigestivibacter sp. TaxID=2847320 RepID=UPI003D913F8A
MWVSFALAILFLVVILYVPGLLALRSLGLSWGDSICGAPVYGVAVVGINSIVASLLGVSASWITVVGPGAVVAIVMYSVHALMHRRSGANTQKSKVSAKPADELLAVLAYVCVGILATFLLYVLSMQSPDEFLQMYDNTFHLSQIRTFVDRADFMPTGSAYYLANEEQPYFVTSSFYPSLYHSLCALSVQVAGISVMASENAVNIVTCAFVFPTSMCCLVRHLFPENRLCIFLGAILCVAFTGYPWCFVVWGPLYPNLVTNALVPAVMTAFIELTRIESTARVRVRSLVEFFVGCVAIVLTQPNGIFTMAAILAAYLVWDVAGLCRRARENGRRAPHPVLGGTLTFVLVAAIWLGCCALPVMRSTVTFDGWTATSGMKAAAVSVLDLSMQMGVPQYLLAALVIVGAIVALCDKRLRWLPFSYAFLAICYVIDVSRDGILKHILGGFFYCDPHRLAANLTIVAIPLSALGFAWLVSALKKLLSRRGSHARNNGALPEVLSSALILAVALDAYFPLYLPGNARRNTSTPFGSLVNTLDYEWHDESNRVLTDEELAFARKAEELVGEDELIINSPNDGSGLLYALDDANLFYRPFAVASKENEEEASWTIRHSLSSYGNSQEVKDAVDSLGAHYLLVLDQGSDDSTGETRARLWSYYPDQWEGIESVSDDTPGFTVVLSEGDMRLYKIGD